jgi:hypothetical protein
MHRRYYLENAQFQQRHLHPPRFRESQSRQQIPNPGDSGHIAARNLGSATKSGDHLRLPCRFGRETGSALYFYIGAANTPNRGLQQIILDKAMFLFFAH